jgi:hypothetical protein
MNSFSLHTVDDHLAALIRQTAKTRKSSVNKTLLHLLEASLGVTPKETSDHSDEFSDLSGVWSDKDKREFETHARPTSRIDPEDWK